MCSASRWSPPPRGRFHAVAPFLTGPRVSCTLNPSMAGETGTEGRDNERSIRFFSYLRLCSQAPSLPGFRELTRRLCLRSYNICPLIAPTPLSARGGLFFPHLTSAQDARNTGPASQDVSEVGLPAWSSQGISIFLRKRDSWSPSKPHSGIFPSCFGESRPDPIPTSAAPPGRHVVRDRDRGRFSEARSSSGV